MHNESAPEELAAFLKMALAWLGAVLGATTLQQWVLASTLPMPEVVDEPPQITEAQADKLIAFLKANPDIIAAAKL